MNGRSEHGQGDSMSSAGRGQDGTPATSDSTATAVVSPSKPSTEEVAKTPHGPRFGRSGRRGGGTAPDKPVAADRPVFQDAGRPLRWLGSQAWFRWLVARVWVRHLALLLVYLSAGIAATWPRFTYLIHGYLPKTSDVASFVWGFWWVAHQVTHFGNPFSTCYMAAPACIQLGFSTLMPLAGIVMTPVTLIWGPAVSFTVISLITPGLLCYTMFRAARLWLNLPGSIAAGAIFGLSSMMLWQNWYHVNIAVGLIFLPVTIEAAVRLRRTQKIGPAVWLGIALGAAVMTSQEGAAIALLIAFVILVPWMIGKLIKDRPALRRALVPLGIGAAVALVIASPQLIAMAQQIASGGAKVPVGTLAKNYTQFGVPLQTLFSPSPRLTYYGLGHLATSYSFNAAVQGGTSIQPVEGLPTFGVVASALALLGVVIGWRKKTTWWFLLLWVGSAILALGTSLVVGSSCIFSQVSPGTLWGRTCHQYMPLQSHIHWTDIAHGGPAVWKEVLVSNLMPYSWLVRIPGLAGLREADRFALVGMIGVALLAGIVVEWITRRITRRKWWLATGLLVVVIGLAVLETGWGGGTSGPPLNRPQTMTTNMAAFDSPIKADHSKSIVLDVPFGLRGGLSLIGSPVSVRALLLAINDGHPRAISYTAWVPKPTINAIRAHPFFRYLMKYQNSTSNPTASELAAAAADLKTLNIGWVVMWRNLWRFHDPLQRLAKLDFYLHELGFRRLAHGGMSCLVPMLHKTPFCNGQKEEEVFLLKFRPSDAFIRH